MVLHAKAITATCSGIPIGRDSIEDHENATAEIGLADDDPRDGPGGTAVGEIVPPVPELQVAVQELVQRIVPRRFSPEIPREHPEQLGELVVEGVDDRLGLDGVEGAGVGAEAGRDGLVVGEVLYEAATGGSVSGFVGGGRSSQRS